MPNIYFLDIDDCLIETSRLGKTELTALKDSLESQNIPKGSQITAEFEKSFHRLYDHHQGKKLNNQASQDLKQYMDKLHKLQTNIIREYGQVKKWSREVFLYIAAEKFGVRLTANQILSSTVSLWKSITDHNPFYPDALKFLHQLLTKKVPFYLISSSDCRLQFDKIHNQFTYNPQYSRKLKLKRLDKFLKLGIPKKNIFIGDPYDKPDLRLFRQAFDRAKSDNPGSFISIMAGDSYNNDLLPARQAGMDELILVKRKKSQTVPYDDKLKVIESFNEIKI